MSVAVIADKSTKDEFGPVVPEEYIIRDVKKAVSYIVENSLASVIEINISCPNAGKEPFYLCRYARDFIKRIRFCREKCSFLG